MKTFKDLEFQDHEFMFGFDHTASHAVMSFPNGNHISVITGKHAFTDDEHPYEVMATGYDDVIGHLDADGVTRIMLELQK